MKLLFRFLEADAFTFLSRLIESLTDRVSRVHGSKRREAQSRLVFD